jgi:hypothetical protein
MYGKDHPRWKGGKHVNNGYVYVRVRTGVYKIEQRIVMEKHLGRSLLKHERVHHINGNKQDNRIENLELHTASSHTQHHWNQGDYKRKPPIGLILCPNCNRVRQHGGHGLCNSCYTKWWVKQNPEHARRLSRERQARYRKLHPEIIRERKLRYRQKIRESRN